MKVTEGKWLAAMLAAHIGVFSLYVLLPAARKYAWAVGLLAAILFALMLFFKKHRFSCSAKRAAAVFLMVICVVTACVRSAAFVERTETEALRYLDGGTHSAEGYITKISYAEDFGSCYEVRLLSMDRRKTELGTVLSLLYKGEFAVGDIVAFEGVFSEPDGEYGVSRKADGIYLSAETENVTKIGEKELKAENFFERIRLSIKNNFESYMDRKEAGFATAIMTGNRDNLSGSVRLAFTRLGISHILAVSGLHLSIIVGGMDILLKLIAIPRKPKNLILIVCAGFFACICGLSASVVRAAVMLSFLYLADTVGEVYDSLTSLFIAVFLIILFRPSAVYDVGMWLSFFATMGILLAMPAVSEIPMQNLPRTVRKALTFILSLLCMTLAASFFTLPIVHLAFGGISVISPLANLVFVPLTQLVLYLLVCLTALGGVPFLAGPIGRAAQGLIAFVCDTANRLSDLRNIYFSLRYPFVPFLLALLVVGILTVIAVKKLRPGHLFAVFALCIAAYGLCYGMYTRMQRDVSYVYVETDGKSDVIGIVSRGEVAIVDVSTGGQTVPKRAIDRAEDFYACEVDLFVLTHYHSYHVGTMLDLVNRIKIHRVLLPSPSTEQEASYCREICERIGDCTEIAFYLTDGTEYAAVGETVLLLPERSFIDRSTHPIVRFGVSVGEDGKGFSYLSEGATETDFSGFGNSVVVLGSHGPTLRHLFTAEPLKNAELVIFSEKKHADLTELSDLKGTVAFAEDYGGSVGIVFE